MSSPREYEMKLHQMKLETRKNVFLELSERQIDSFVATINNLLFASNDIVEVAKLVNTLYLLATRILKPGGRLVLYSYTMNPLIDLHSYIKTNRKTWANSKFEEFISRTMTLQKGSSHPEMNIIGKLGGGFILSATKLVDADS